MKTYRYWAKASAPVEDAGEKWNVQCYGGSNESVEAALRHATQRAAAAAEAIARGTVPSGDGYPYGDRPLREEILQEFEQDGRRTAVLTRNAYGSLIVNTPYVLFADVDYRPRSLAAIVGDGIAKLFGRPRPTQDEQVVARIERAVQMGRGLGIRLYRTANGFRCIVTTRTFDPTSQETADFLIALDTDPLYLNLCRVQECFRARLSPKPWRCGVPRPPCRFPWANEEAEQTYRQWEAAYEAKADRFATCMFIGAFGASQVHPEVEPILTLHDQLACIADVPLA